jgi:hypothetical protein
MARKAPVARIALIAAVLVLVLALVPVAFAGKGKPGGGGSTSGTGTLKGPVMVLDNNGDGLANHYDEITFNVSTTATSTPEVGLRCYQGSNWVYDNYVGYFPGYMFTPYFPLDSSYWVSGVAASCTARLFYRDSKGNEHVLATLSFTAAP